MYSVNMSVLHLELMKRDLVYYGKFNEARGKKNSTR